MFRTIALSFLFVVMALPLAACADDDEATPRDSGSPPGPSVVRAQNRTFLPSTIEISAGVTATIALQNDDDTPHTLTVYLAATPEGAIVADTAEVPAGGRGEATMLFASGEHAFRCELHPEQMQGEIVVK